MRQPTTTSLAVGLDRIASRAVAAARAIDRADRLVRQITTTSAPRELTALVTKMQAELAEASAALSIIKEE